MATPAVRSVGSSSGTVNNLGRNNLVVGETVTLSDTAAANAGHSHVWSFVSKPVGSSASLSTPSAATSTFSPDVTGSYMVKCVVDTVATRIVILAVPLARSAGRIPAFSEALEYDGASNTVGWHEALTTMLRWLDTYPVTVGGQIGGTPAVPTVIGVRETSGPTLLTMGSVADGKVLARSGSTIVGVNGGHTIENTLSVLATRGTMNFTGALQAVDAGAGPDRIDLNLVDTAVTPGTYAPATLTVDQKGRLTAASVYSGAALSVLGRSANSGGADADIATTSGTAAVLRESGGVLGFGTVATAGLAANAVTDAILRQGAARTLIGRNGSSTGNVADIQATNASDAVMRESGGSIGFGTVATAGLANLAVTTAKLAANAVTDTVLRQGAARTVIGRNANSTGDVADIAGAGADTFLSDDASTLAFRTAYAEVQAAGVAVTRRSKLNFGSDFTTADNGGSTRTDVVLAAQGSVAAGSYTSTDLTVNSKGIITAIANSAPVSIVGKPLTYSICDVANAGLAATSNTPGNQTTGQAFYNQKAMTCTGVRFYWKKNATNRTFNVAIWSIDSNTTGTKLANIDVSVTTTGIYTGTFSSPVSLAACSRWMVSVWEKSGSEYVAGGHAVSVPYDACVVGYTTVASTGSRTLLSVGPYLFTGGFFVAGANTYPGTAQPNALSDDYYPLEPILNDIVL